MAIVPVSSRFEQRVVIQFSAAWPTSDASWATVANYIPNSVSESLGNELGSATFVQYLGSVLPIGKKVYSALLTAADAVPDQAYIRVGVETADGEIKVDPDSGPAVDALGNPVKDRYTAIHYGRVLKRTFSANDEVGNVAGITSAGLGIILDQVSVPSGAVWGADSASAIKGGEFGPFNPGGFGNASFVTYPLSSGAMVKVIQPYTLKRWLAIEVAELLIALVNLQQPVVFEIDPQTRDLLNYSDTWDFRGMNASQILSSLANNRRGTNWRPVYIADPSPRVRIVFDSALAGTTSISIPPTPDDTLGQAYLIKPASNQQTLNLVAASRLPQSADHRVTSCALTQDARGCYDEIILVGGKRMRTMAVEFILGDTGQLVKGWPLSDEAIWDAASSFQAMQASPQLDHVWRSFKFKDSWDGTDRGGSQISNYLATSPAEPYGPGLGETGEWGIGPYINGVTGPFFQPLRMTGVWQGVNFNSAISQDEIDRLTAKQRQQPPIPPFMALYDGAGNYTPITGTTNEMSVTVDQETGCIILGNGPADALVIKAWAAAGLRIVLTLGVGLPYPVRVSWRRSATPARTLVLRTSSVESTLAPGTMLGIQSGVIKTNTYELVLERCASRMRAVLGLMKLWYASQEQTLTYTVSGLVSPWADPNAPPPGTMITTAVLPQGSFTLNQVVTRREWNFTGAPSVSITTARVLPSIDSFL